jgi:hypothetical protein
MPRDGQLHPTFPAFQRWVIDKLVGILANDPTNVVLTIVGRWIDANEEYLKTREVTYGEWRKSLRPQGVVVSIQEHAEPSSAESPLPAETDDADNGSGEA